MQKSERCPSCGSNDIKRIVYGMPANERNIPEGVELGGCVIEDGSCIWSCGACQHQWGSEKENSE